MKPAYYNEFNPYAADWLLNLIAEGLIPHGEVDTRSIEDVHPSDLQGFVQCHFFAGIGGWPLALRAAGWADDRPVWTGSCPCQPFSSAGEGAGFADERHLWPHFYHLISAHRDWCRQQKRSAPVLLGEQVASKDADAWIDLVCADLEALGDAFAAIPFPSSSIGAPHIRDRNYWVGYPDRSTGGKGRAHVRGRAAGSNAQSRAGSGGAGVLSGVGDADSQGSQGRSARARGEGAAVALSGDHLRLADTDRQRGEGGDKLLQPGYDQHGSGTSRLANTGGERLEGFGLQLQPGKSRPARAEAGRGIQDGRLANPDGRHAGSEWQQRVGEQRLYAQHAGLVRLGSGGCEDRVGIELGPGPINGMWRDADWLFCRDAKWRPVEAGTFPLADGLPRGLGSCGAELERLAGLAGLDNASLARAKAYRVGALRGYGNAINPEQAAEFIRAVMEAA